MQEIQTNEHGQILITGEDGQTYPVPDLFVCVQRDDTLAVFPETAGVTCDDLGLRAAD